VGARDGAPGGLRGVVRGEDDAVRAGADPGEIVLRNQMTWKNNVNLAQTEVRGDGGPTAALRRLGRLRREHCCALRQVSFGMLCKVSLVSLTYFTTEKAQQCWQFRQPPNPVNSLTGK